MSESAGREENKQISTAPLILAWNHVFAGLAMMSSLCSIMFTAFCASISALRSALSSFSCSVITSTSRSISSRRVRQWATAAGGTTRARRPALPTRLAICVWGERKKRGGHERQAAAVNIGGGGNGTRERKGGDARTSLSRCLSRSWMNVSDLPLAPALAVRPILWRYLGRKGGKAELAT